MQRTNPFQLIARKVPKPLRNKYILALLVFFIVVVLIDRHNLWTQWKLKKSVNQLEHDKEYYSRKIEEAKQDQQNLENNKEKFAREKYHMHKADEEVFLIEEKK